MPAMCEKKLRNIQKETNKFDGNFHGFFHISTFFYDAGFLP